MKKAITHKEYVQANLRLEELIDLVDDSIPETDPLAVELIEVSNLIETYEEIHYPVGLPSLVEVIELRMFEMKLKKKDLAVILSTNASRISDYLSGKREITLNVAKALRHKLNIDSDIILQ
jgi:HTH-type transcriptional regulator/antitoxin HigA